MAIMVRTSRVAASRYNEFAIRRRLGFGDFLTERDIILRAPRRLADLFTRLPGWVTSASGEIRSSRSLECTRWFLDGLRVAGNIEDIVSPEDMLAIEAYRSGAQAPLPYNVEECGVVLLWTKAMRPDG
jgi:hypothetical protein